VRTVEPAGPEEVSAVLADAARSDTHGTNVINIINIIIRGGGTKSEWGGKRGPDTPSANDILLTTARLNRIIAHRHGDLTATVEAGAVLDDVNRELERHGQWIPLDPVWPDRATIGGILATNDSGPRRHRYGTPRDLIIGIEIARADGVRAKAGGIVVKNVAGYDLGRLMTGSFGCLGVILSATFKLYPRSPASGTVVVERVSPASARAIVSALEQNQLTPTAVEMEMPPLGLLIRFESIEASVEQQTAVAARVAAAQGGRTTILRGADEELRWRLHGERPWGGPGAVAKLTCLPADLAAILEEIAAAENCAVEAVGRAGVGVLLVRIDGDVQSQSRLVGALRRRHHPGNGSVVLLRASDELASAVGVWGPMGDAFPLMQSVKRAFDPRGVLNPGRGPGGL
jgi:glycolate oxidase FAD binding subunit